MMPLSMKTYLALLWGVSVSYAMASDMNASATETSSINSIAEPPKPAEISVASPADTTVETKEAITTYRGDRENDSTPDLVTMNAVAATTSRTEPQWLHTPAAVNTTAGAAHPSHNAMILETATPREDHDMTAPATASVAPVAVSLQQPSSTTKSEVTSKLPPIASPENVQAPVFNQTHSVPSATTTMTASPTSEAAPVSEATKSETFSTSTELVSTSQLVSGTAGLSSTAESPTITLSTKSPISTTKVSTTDVSTTKVSITDVSTTDISTTNVSTTNLSTTDISTTDVSTTNVSTTKVSTTNVSTTDVSTTEVSITDVSTTDVSFTNVSTTNVSITDVSTTDVSTTDVSTSPIGILIPREPKKLPVPTTKSTPVTTTAPRENSKSPPSTEVQPCSTRSAEKRCLIAIASLAALATVFMVSTIILCTKLSKRKYKVKTTQPATEMMCISALLPERNITYSRQRNPVTNGVLVIHDDEDSDEDGGDNLTLSSFLPENDRFV